MNEIWRMHPVHNDYEVSNWGRVRRLTPQKGTRVGKVLKATRTKFGYESVALGRNLKFRTFFIHVLVLETFVGPRPNGFECLHDNDVKHDNVLSNLKWGTHAENYADRVASGGGNHGSRHGLAKLKEVDIVQIRSRYVPKVVTQKMLAAEFDVSRECISRVVRHTRWTHV